MKLRLLIPTILSTITRTNRYLPNIEWSNKSWTHNIFRAYEWLCFRREGIRAEGRSYNIIVNGIIKTVEESYTFEHSCALFESYVRKTLNSIKDKKLELQYEFYLPILQTSNGFIGMKMLPHIRFAVAYSATSTYVYSGGASAVATVSHTISGSDTILIGHATGGQSPTATVTATYNSVSMTEVNHSLDNVGTGVPTYMFRKVAPTTGTNNYVATSSTNGVVASCVSYTGVDQTTPNPENDATALNTNTASMSKSLTTTVNNSWLVMTFRTGSGNALTAGSGTTVRTQPEVVAFGAGAIIDSNTALATGSNTLAVTCTSQFFGGQIIVSLAPVVAAKYRSPSGSAAYSSPMFY